MSWRGRSGLGYIRYSTTTTCLVCVCVCVWCELQIRHPHHHHHHPTDPRLDDDEEFLGKEKSFICAPGPDSQILVSFISSWSFINVHVIIISPLFPFHLPLSLTLHFIIILTHPIIIGIGERSPSPGWHPCIIRLSLSTLHYYLYLQYMDNIFLLSICIRTLSESWPASQSRIFQNSKRTGADREAKGN